MDEYQATRRRYLLALGAAGTVGLAGCIAEDATPSNATNGSDPAEESGTTAQPAASGTPDGSRTAAQPDLDGYLDGANNYDGFVDARGVDDVRIAVGAGDSGLAFDPPAVHVDPGTTIGWEWTGEGGAHNLVAEDGSFSSGSVVGEAGHAFETYFSDQSVTRYYCAPHEAVGMRGAVLVGGGGLDSYAGSYDPNAGDAPDGEIGGDEGPEPNLGGYLDDAINYDGSATDMTGRTEVTVEVGSGDNGLGFGPAAVRVDPGATVVWEWTGEGGAHNVVAEDGSFESGDVVSERGATYEFAFEEPGIYTYYCTPHKAIGMKGAVVVGADYPTA